MSESLWQSDVVEEAQPEEPAANRAAEPAAESSAVTLSADDFSALEERISARGGAGEAGAAGSRRGRGARRRGGGQTARAGAADRRTAKGGERAARRARQCAAARGAAALATGRAGTVRSAMAQEQSAQSDRLCHRRDLRPALSPLRARYRAHSRPGGDGGREDARRGRAVAALWIRCAWPCWPH